MGGAAAAAGGRRVVGAPSQQPAAQMSGADESWLAGGSNWCELLLVLLVGHRTRLRLDQEGFLLRGQQQEEVCGNAMAFQKKKNLGCFLQCRVLCACPNTFFFFSFNRDICQLFFLLEMTKLSGFSKMTLRYQEKCRCLMVIGFCGWSYG